jgi:alpha-tubulin suppressor-like RCC1 family protein
VVPERGRTIDLRTPSGAAGGDPGSLHASYADSAEPTWATTPDEPEAKRRGPQDRRRRLLYAGAGTIAMAAVGLAFYGGEAPASSTVEQADTAAAAPDGRAPAGLAVGRDDRSARPPIAPAPAGAYLAAGGRHGCTMTVAGSLVCWGANDRGQLGDGTAAVQAGPVAVAGDLAFVSVSAGLLHTCAVTRLGDVYCWGADDRGQLGDATTIRRNAPVRIAGLGTYASVSAGAAHTCGVTTDGALRCWGANDQAQLGDGTRDSRSAPTPVLVGNAPVVSVAAGGQHTCAVTDDGRLYCWGANNDGQLGSGERGAYRAAPAPVAVAGRATSVTAGLAHSCALTGDGAVTCWGRVETGDARAGAPSGPAGPAHVRFADTVPVVAIASGGAHACALTAVGRVWCWGRNTRGALGDGTTRPRSEPVRVALPGPAVAVTAGNAHTCAALASGRTYCWGENQNGQLGDPMRTARFVPAPVRFPAGVRPLGGRAAPPVAVGSPPTTTAP